MLVCCNIRVGKQDLATPTNVLEEHGYISLPDPTKNKMAKMGNKHKTSSQKFGDRTAFVSGSWGSGGQHPVYTWRPGFGSPAFIVGSDGAEGSEQGAPLQGWEYRQLGGQ
jgi:hypothetical protein